MKIRKMQTAAGGPLRLTPEEQKYYSWINMSPEQRRQNRNNRVKAYLQSGPNITNFWKAFQTYIGNRDPENPHLNIGIVNAPGRATPQQVQQSAKLMETINNYWKNLGKLKIRLGGNGKYASGILTKPGTAPTTFNGQNISYITSPKGGNVIHKFYTDQGSEYILTKDGFARRIKSPHSNVGGSDSGLHDWNEGTTIFTKGEDGKTFNLAFDVLGNKYKGKFLKYGLIRENGIAKIMGIDPTTNQWRYIKYSDIYPQTIKQGLRQDGIIQAEYSDIPFLEGNILEKTSGSWHPGSSVAFIEGLKQGGKMNILEFLKNGSGIHIKEKNKGKFTSYCGGKVTDECIRKAKASGNPTLVKRATFAQNSRRWSKHKNGGILQFLQQGNKIDWAGMIGNFASQALQTYAQNKQIQAQADQQKEANNAQKVSPMEYVFKYFQEMMDEENRRNEAIKAITGTTINSSDIVGKFFAHQRGKQEAFAHNKEIDNQNKLIDAEAKGQKSQGWMNLFSNGLQSGIGMLANNIGKSNNNIPPSSTITTTSYIQPKLTTNTWTPNTTLNTTLGQYSTPLTDSNKFWNK